MAILLARKKFSIKREKLLVFWKTRVTISIRIDHKDFDYLQNITVLFVLINLYYET